MKRIVLLALWFATSALAQTFPGSFGQAVLVENKAGAASMIATQDVKRSAPDGYTLYVTTLTHSVNAILMSESGFPGFEEYTQGLGVVGPAGIPGPVASRLNEAMRAWLAKDLERWDRVIKAAGVKAE